MSLERIRELVAARRYFLTGHATNQFLGTALRDTSDLEYAISNAIVLKTERDERDESDYKYALGCETRAGHTLYCAGKIVEDESGEWFKIISID